MSTSKIPVQKHPVQVLGTTAWNTTHTIQLPHGEYPFLVIIGSTIVAGQTWGDGSALLSFPASVGSVSVSNYVLTVNLNSQWGCFVIAFT